MNAIMLGTTLMSMRICSGRSGFAAIIKAVVGAAISASAVSGFR
jgi:hypothetical protein